MKTRNAIAQLVPPAPPAALSAAPVLVGLDIGYSNLKLAYGPLDGEPRVLVRPAGAAPAQLLARRISGHDASDSAVYVPMADGTEWVVGVDQGRLEAGWQRTLHEDYTATPAYAALAAGALILTGARHIATLVTGLPAAQAADPTRVAALQQLLGGTHAHPQGGVIQVDEVRVLAQPVGAYLDVIASIPDETVVDRIAYGVVIIIDAGYYSFDWSVIVEGELRQHASGTSLEAMSVILARAAASAVARAGGRPQPGTLEQALRARRSHLYQRGMHLEVDELLDAAARETAPVALDALRQALRRETRDIDLVILAGGGCRYYRDAVETLFPQARMVVPSDALASNARGFFAHAAA